MDWTWKETDLKHLVILLIDTNKWESQEEDDYERIDDKTMWKVCEDKGGRSLFETVNKKPILQHPKKMTGFVFKKKIEWYWFVVLLVWNGWIWMIENVMDRMKGDGLNINSLMLIDYHMIEKMIK